MNRLVKAGDRDSVEESRYQGPKRCSATITFASQSFTLPLPSSWRGLPTLSSPSTNEFGWAHHWATVLTSTWRTS